MNQHPPPRKGCADAAFTFTAVFLLITLAALAGWFRKEINQAVDDYRSLPARVKALEESVRNTNEMLYKNLKP